MSETLQKMSPFLKKKNANIPRLYSKEEIFECEPCLSITALKVMIYMYFREGRTLTLN